MEAPRGMELAAAAIARAKRHEKPDLTGQEAPAMETANAAGLHDQAGDEDEGKEDNGESGKTVSG